MPENIFHSGLDITVRLHPLDFFYGKDIFGPPVEHRCNNKIEWVRNTNYLPSQLIEKHPEKYDVLGMIKNKSIYKTFEDDPDTFLYVSHPQLKQHIWTNFEP